VLKSLNGTGIAGEGRPRGGTRGEGLEKRRRAARPSMRTVIYLSIAQANYSDEASLLRPIKVNEITLFTRIPSLPRSCRSAN
jgi:hypothetical protein